MNQLKDGPNDNYNFGYDFDYAVWSANTDITLTNVPWNNDYRDIVYFETTNDLNNYINRNTSANITLKGTYAKATEPILLSTPFNVANRFNYVRVYNPAQPIQGDTPKYFYYFITDVRYVAPNTTAIIVQLDVVQTYIRNVRFGRSYIERGHIGIANEDNYRNYGRDFLTVPEGIDVGDSYQIVRRQRRQVINRAGKTSTSHINDAPVGASILVVTTVDLKADPGTRDNPKLVSARGSWSGGLVSGAAMYLFKTEYDFVNFMARYAQYPWVTQGIISISYIPAWSRYYSDAHLGARLPFGGYEFPSAGGGDRPFNIVEYNNVGSGGDFRNDVLIRRHIGPRYEHLMKFRTFPYLAIRVASNTGQQVILQPERWNSKGGQMKEMFAIAPPNSRVSVFPFGYDSSVDAAEGWDAGPYLGSDLDYAVSISNFPTVPLVNNQAILYMAQNAHSTAYGYQAASWAQQRALRGNEVSYDQATAGIRAGSDLAENQLAGARRDLGIGNEISAQQALTRNIQTVGGGIAGGAAVGGAAGAAIGAVGGLASAVFDNVGTLINQGGNSQRYASMAQTVRGATAISGALGETVRDTNKQLSDFAARGDYENTIAGLNAKIQDAQLSAPSVVGQQGGEPFNVINGIADFRVEVLMPSQGIINAVGEYWLRYGYAVNRFSLIPQNLKVMTKFTYWKLKETYIRAGDMPETFKQALRGILEKGVTVWNDPDDIGVVDPADNKPLQGIKLDGYVPPEPDPEPTPEPPIAKKRNKKMIVFSSVDQTPSSPGNVWALAGTSPGTDANFIETRNASEAAQWLEFCQADSPVGIDWITYQEYRDTYRGPIATYEYVPSEVE